jgi:hypothetical protein
MTFDNAIEEARIAMAKGYDFSILYDNDTQQCAIHLVYKLKNKI